MSDNYKNFWVATLNSFGFFIYYTSYNGLLNLETSTLSEDGFGQLGFICISITYFLCGVVSIFCPSIIKRVGDKGGQVWAAILTVPFYLSFLFVTVKSDYPDKDSWIYNKSFVTVMVIIPAILNGLT